MFAAGVSLIAGAVFSGAPAWHVAQGGLTAPLRDGSARAGEARGARLARRALIVGEIALAVVALVGTSLFARTFVGLRRTDLGFDPARLMTMRVVLPGARYDAPDARARAVAQMVRGLSAVPGVTAATISDLIPLDDEGGSEGQAVSATAAGTTGLPIVYSGIAGRWFETFGQRVIAGRAPTARELEAASPVAVVSRTMATRLWPGGDALGQRFRLADDSAGTWFSVIGVAADIRTKKLDETGANPPEAYLPLAFVPTRDYGIMLRTSLAPGTLASSAQAAIHAVDATVPVFNVWTMEDVRYLSFWMYALWSALFGVFGVLALALAAMGVYAVMFAAVARRKQEIGVRMALGAGRAAVVRLVVGEAMSLAAIGIGAGVVGGIVFGRAVGSLLIRVSPIDSVSFAGAALLLAGAALVASYLPARRAATMDPLRALRQE